MSTDPYDFEKVEEEAQYWEEYFGMEGSSLATEGDDSTLPDNAEIREGNARHRDIPIYLYLSEESDEEEPIVYDVETPEDLGPFDTFEDAENAICNFSKPKPFEVVKKGTNTDIRASVPVTLK